MKNKFFLSLLLALFFSSSACVTIGISFFQLESFQIIQLTTLLLIIYFLSTFFTLKSEMISEHLVVRLLFLIVIQLIIFLALLATLIYADFNFKIVIYTLCSVIAMLVIQSIVIIKSLTNV